MFKSTGVYGGLLMLARAKLRHFICLALALAAFATGTTVNMNGTALYEAVTVIFIAQVLDTSPFTCWCMGRRGLAPWLVGTPKAHTKPATKPRGLRVLISATSVSTRSCP